MTLPFHKVKGREVARFTAHPGGKYTHQTLSCNLPVSIHMAPNMRSANPYMHCALKLFKYSLGNRLP